MAFSALLVAPPANYGSTIQAAPTGNTYNVGATGLVTVTNAADIMFLIENGFMPTNNGLPFSSMLIGKLIGANMNATTDQAFTMFPLPPIPFRVTKISAKNASISLTTAAGGVYPTTAKGGTAIVAAAQAYSGLTTASLILDLTMVNTIQPAPTAATLFYLSLTTAQGVAATADLYMFADFYP